MKLDKKQKKGLIRGLITGIIVMLLIVVLGFFLFSQDPAIRFTVKNFYDNPKANIIFMGNSHCLCGVDVDLFNNKTNEDCYVLSTGGQSISNTVYLAEEAIKTNDVDVLYVEVFSLIYDYQHHSSVYNLKKSPLKFKTRFSKDDNLTLVQSFFPLLRYHARWKLPHLWNKYLFSKPIHTREKEKYDLRYYKGSLLQNTVLSEKWLAEYSDYTYEFDAAGLIKERAHSVDALIDLCDENDVEIVFFMAPWLERFFENSNYKDVNSTLVPFFKSRDKIYLDFNSIDIGVIDGDFINEKMSNSQHLNKFGAEKLTAYLSEFHNENFR